MDLKFLSIIETVKRDSIRNETIRVREEKVVYGCLKKLRMQVLQWLGYVKRTDVNRISRQALEIQIEGKRSKGQFRWRWHIQETDSIKGTGNVWSKLLDS